MGKPERKRRVKYEKNRIHFASVSCATCNKSFKRLPILEQHFKSAHLNYRATCPICKKKFNSKSDCYRHSRKVHSVNTKIKIKFKPYKTVRSVQSNVNESFPSMSTKIAEKNTKKFGCHLISTQNIEDGELVMASAAFASVEYVSSIGKGCFNCGKDNQAIQCEYCIDVYFCSILCSANREHRVRCNKTYVNTDCRSIRLIAEIIDVATRNVRNILPFLQFCCGVLHDEKNPNKCQPPYFKPRKKNAFFKPW